VEVSSEFIQIKPMILNQLKKQSTEFQITVLLNCVIGQKNHLKTVVIAISTNFMEFQP